MSIRYPADAAGGADYVSFQHKSYKGRGGGGQNGGDIVLYIPAPAPSISNVNSWQGSGDAFSGPLGQFKRGMVQRGSDIVNDKNFSLGKIPQYVNSLAEELKSHKLGPIARNIGNNELAKAVGLSASQMMSVTRGEIYNPNVEMFYSGPQLRNFTFSFQCAPASSGDAQAIRQIVSEFKKWSAPEESGDKYKLPHVWDISYGGKCKQYYNKFKTAALKNVNVTYNAGLDGHMTFDDGSPIVTGFSLSFIETELITRKDAGRY